jgi:acetyl esterase/lipase
MIHPKLRLIPGLLLCGAALAAAQDGDLIAARDIPYREVEGVDPNLLSLDVYTLEDAADRPLLVMIHGGGWRTGDKARRSMTEPKAPYFVGQGFVYVSINYRLSDGSGIQHPTHVQDVAHAVAWVHEHAAEYGGDPERVFLMGHSAGAHLAALVSTDERYLVACGQDLSFLRGTICLDTGGYDIPRRLAEAGPDARVGKLYQNAFGEHEEGWRDASPLAHVAAGKAIPPMLLIHADDKPEKERMTESMARSLQAAGVPAQVVAAPDKDHAGINACIGRPGDPYTARIMAFLADPGGSAEAPADYDPLSVPEQAAAAPVDLVAEDLQRKRDVPLRVYLPDSEQPAPVVLFSHGLGGSRENNPYLGRHWSARGYVAVFLQHPGSDERVWKDVPPGKRMAALKGAASLESFLERVKDVPVVLDQLEAWNIEQTHPLAGRLDLTRVGMSGHSFGAITTQSLGGQSTGRRGPLFTDERIDAALALSPSPPPFGSAARAFGSVKIPWMLMTGTRDGSPLDDRDPSTRLEVYPALPADIARYELVLWDAEHSAFGERALPGETAPRNPNHHRTILALSTAFWDAHLRGDSNAKAWLQGAGPRSVMDKKDTWRTAPGR